MQDSNLDVVIFSRDRELALWRTLKFLSTQPFRTIVLHNSKKSLPAKEFAKNIIYRSCPGMDFSRRAALAASMLNSEYGLILADDERLIEAGVDQMLSVLRKNPFLASVGGRTLAVYFYRGLLKLHFPYKQMCGYVSQEKNCKTRLIRHMNGLGFMPIGAMYRIFRTKYLVELLLTFSKLSNISTPYKFQFAAEYMSPVFGPSIYLDDLYWVRNWDTPMISKKDWDRNLTFFLWWEEESFKDERLQFCTLLSEKSKIPVEKVGAVFNCMFEDFGSREEPVMGTLGKFKHFISSNYRSNEIRRVGLDQLADRVGFELRKEWPGMGDIHIKQASEAIQSLIPISHKGLFVP